MSDDPDFEPNKRKVVIGRIRNWSPEETYAFLTIWKKNYKLIKLLDSDEPDRSVLQSFIGKALRYGGSERTDREISNKMKTMVKSFRYEEEASIKNDGPSTWKYYGDMKEILDLENSLNDKSQIAANVTYIPHVVISEDQAQSLMVDSDVRDDDELYGYGSNPDSRRKNFSAFEKQLVLELVKQHAPVIDSRRLDVATVHRKRAAWEGVTRQYNATPGVLQRTTGQLMNLYKNVKKRSPEKRRLDVTDEATDGDEMELIVGTSGSSSPFCRRTARKRFSTSRSEALAGRKLQLMEEMHRLEVEHRRREHELKMKLMQAQLSLVEGLKEKIDNSSCTIKFPSDKGVVIE